MGIGAAWRQAVFARPLEWFWRMLTYWEVPPLVRKRP